MSDTAPTPGHVPAELVDVTIFRNHYHCEDCDETWADTWCCCCDDECPGCGKSFSPEDSDEIETQQLRKGVDICDACGSTHEW